MSDKPTITGGATSPEWRLLELLTVGVQTADQRAELESILGQPTLHWGTLLDQAIRHKMLPLLADEIAAGQYWNALPPILSEHLRESLQVSRHRVSIYRSLAADVTSALRARSIDVACTKGIVLEALIYGGRGQRYLGDVDLMVRPEDGERVSAALREMGFVNGYIQRSSGAVQAHTRKDLIAYRLNPDHVPPFVKATDDPIFPTLQIDLACSFTWARSDYQVPVAEAMEQLMDVELPGTGGRVVPTLATEYLFLFTVLHLFREAWVGTWIELGQDVNLMKFGDVVRSWQAWRERLLAGGFRRLLDRFDLARPVGWVLVHADRTFGLDMAASLGLEDVVSEDFLGSGASRGGTAMRRRGSMLEWLSSTSRADLFSEA